MSSQNYCHNCGSKQVSVAKFCSSCGTSLASLKETPKTHEVYTRNKEATVVGAYDNEDGDANYLDHIQSYQPKISALAVDLGLPQGGNKRKIGESIGQMSTNPFGESSFSRPTPPTVSPEEALKQFRQEAGNTDKKTEIQ